MIDSERISGSQISEIHSDDGSEFRNQAVNLLRMKEKIMQETCAPGCPQQNGYIEREMQTIMQATCTILRASKHPLTLWKEAVGTAVYLKNRLPTKKSSKTPFERLLGR